MNPRHHSNINALAIDQMVLTRESTDRFLEKTNSIIRSDLMHQGQFI